MITYGTYSEDGKVYAVIINNTKRFTEICMAQANSIVSAYKIDIDTEYGYQSNLAKTLFSLLNKGMRGCTAKNAISKPFVLGTMVSHETRKGKTDYQISFYRDELCAAYISSEQRTLDVYYNNEVSIPNGIPYVQLTKIDKRIKNLAETDLNAVPCKKCGRNSTGKRRYIMVGKKALFCSTGRRDS